MDDDAESCVDWDAARNLTGGDDELLDELIDMFPLESARHLEAIRLAIEQSDGPSLTRAAHTLKSSARLFGAAALAERAQEMEGHGQSSNFELASDGVAGLETELDRVIDALKLGRPQG
jgi:HPt (histidine-containing phosphotransfer) domain-containing protein